MRMGWWRKIDWTRLMNDDVAGNEMNSSPKEGDNYTTGTAQQMHWTMDSKGKTHLWGANYVPSGYNTSNPVSGTGQLTLPWNATSNDLRALESKPDDDD
jgi:hypothetical protein